MTSFDRFERSLPALFDELATPRIPDYYDDVMARTAATRQRPGWTFPERWLPMSALTRRFAAAPRIPWRLGVARRAPGDRGARRGARRRRPAQPTRRRRTARPATARSCSSTATGQVVVGDPIDGLDRRARERVQEQRPAVLAGRRADPVPRTIRQPRTVNLVVAALDGSSIRHVERRSRSRRRTSVLVAERRPLPHRRRRDAMLLAYDTRRRLRARQNLSAPLGLRALDVGLGYNFRSTQAFRPPSGERDPRSTDSGTRLVAIRADGTASRTVLDGSTSPVPFTHLKGAEWSPDGTRIAVLLEQAPDAEQWHALHDERGRFRSPAARPKFATNSLGDQNSPLWSPDGTRLAYQHWLRHPDDRTVRISSASAIVDARDRAAHDVGPVADERGTRWELVARRDVDPRGPRRRLGQDPDR